MSLLGVNIDHIASLRQLRQGISPEPVLAALVCQAHGADSIVAHLREDRRHIREQDLLLIKKVIRIPLNLEMSIAEEIIEFACTLKPQQATLVPEKRQELTTEGGLNVLAASKRIKNTVTRLTKHGIQVSLFIDPDKKQITAAKETGAGIIELHTGNFADAKTLAAQEKELRKLKSAFGFASRLGLTLNAGHGLNYDNVKKLSAVKDIHEFNIGYSIICRALFVGLAHAVKEMKTLVR